MCHLLQSHCLHTKSEESLEPAFFRGSQPTLGEMAHVGETEWPELFPVPKICLSCSHDFYITCIFKRNL